MQDANQRQDERYAHVCAKASERAELAQIDTRLEELDKEASLLRVTRRRILSRIRTRARS